MYLYLQEALCVLKQVQSTVAAVVLLRDSAVGAPHVVRPKETRRPPPDLPLHLQVAADDEEETSHLSAGLFTFSDRSGTS